MIYPFCLKGSSGDVHALLGWLLKAEKRTGVQVSIRLERPSSAHPASAWVALDGAPELVLKMAGDCASSAAAKQVEFSVGPNPTHVLPDEVPTSSLDGLLIEEMNFSTRTHNCLKRSSIHTVGDLRRQSEDDLLDIHNFGSRSLEEVKESLRTLDLDLRVGPPAYLL